MNTPEDNREDLAKQTHQGFTITCDKCGSRVVIVDSSVGFSEASGAWGSVDLDCKDCDNYTEIWSA